MPEMQTRVFFLKTKTSRNQRQDFCAVSGYFVEDSYKQCATLERVW